MKMLTKLLRFLFGEKDELLFYTHTPEYYRKGTFVDGNLITRVVACKPVLILDYQAQCWKVYGRKWGYV